MLNPQESGGLLSAFAGILGSVYQPSLKALQEWGDLCESPQGRKSRKNFVDNFDNFLAYMKSKFLLECNGNTFYIHFFIMKCVEYNDTPRLSLMKFYMDIFVNFLLL